MIHSHTSGSIMIKFNIARLSIRSYCILIALAILVLSVTPLCMALFLDKSGYLVTMVTIWYPLLPPLVLFLLAYARQRLDGSWLRGLGIIWITTGIWFAFQLLFILAAKLTMMLKILALPSLFGGERGIILGAMILPALGIIAWIVSKKFPAHKKILLNHMNQTVLRVIAVVIPSLLIVLLFALGSGIFISERNSSVRIPSRDVIFGYIRDVYNLGIRRPGSTADKAAIDYLEKKLRDFGITDVHSEPCTFDYWEPHAWGLSYINAKGEKRKLESFYVPYSGPTPKEGITAEILYAGEGTDDDFARIDAEKKIILVDIYPVNITWYKMKLFSYFAYDPRRSMKNREHAYPISWRTKFRNVYSRAKDRGVAGIIAILHGYPDMGAFTYYAPYDGVLRPIPSMYITGQEGDNLKTLLKHERLSAIMKMQADVSRNGGKTSTVYGIVPGNSDRAIMIHSHHDSPWRSAVEDSSGVGMVLALAQYYSGLPKEYRRHSLIFLFAGSHMVDMPDTYAFIKRHRNGLMKNVILDICIEHIADDYNPPEVPSGDPEARGFFVSENPFLTSLLAKMLATHDLQRSLIFPTGTPLGVPTDAEPFQQNGIPIVSLLSGPVWMFDDDDTLERVPQDQLEPLAGMYIDFIANIRDGYDRILSINYSIVILILVILAGPGVAVVCRTESGIRL
jgi:hypothetical protein